MSSLRRGAFCLCCLVTVSGSWNLVSSVFSHWTMVRGESSFVGLVIVVLVRVRQDVDHLSVSALGVNVLLEDG